MNANKVYTGEILSPGTAEGVATGLEGEGDIFVAEKVTPLDFLKIIPQHKRELQLGKARCRKGVDNHHYN